MSFIRPTHPTAQLIQEAKQKYHNGLPLFMNVLNIDLRPYSLRIRIKYVLNPFYTKYQVVMDKQDWTFKQLEKRIRAYEKRMPKAVYQQYMTEYLFWKVKEKTREPVVVEMKRIRRAYLNTPLRQLSYYGRV